MDGRILDSMSRMQKRLGAENDMQTCLADCQENANCAIVSKIAGDDVFELHCEDVLLSALVDGGPKILIKEACPCSCSKARADCGV